MSTEHRSYDQIARERRSTADYREGYDEARGAFLIGQAVRERRLALGLSQTEVATRAGMTQPALSRLEAGGAVPTIPVLDRIATALGAELVLTIAPTQHEQNAQPLLPRRSSRSRGYPANSRSRRQENPRKTDLVPASPYRYRYSGHLAVLNAKGDGSGDRRLSDV